jgi:hypothetical protein
MATQTNYSPKKQSLSSLIKAMIDKALNWFVYQIPLWEALLVALSIHVLLFPVLWLMGWILPWPKSPDITTVIEINLENWPNEAKTEKIIDIYYSKHFKEEKK